MTNEARFDSKQPEISVYPEGTKNRFIILENERTETVNDQGIEGSTETHTNYVYDMTTFAEEASVLNPEEVKAFPRDYLDYTPVNAPAKEESKSEQSTLSQQIAQNTADISAINDAIADLANALGGE